MESCIISHAVGLYNLHIHTLGISNALHLRQFYNKHHSSSLILQFYELLLYDEMIKKQKAGHREKKYVRHHTQFSSTMYNMH